MAIYGILFGVMAPYSYIHDVYTVIAPNATMVVYGILFGGVHPIFISMMCT